MMLFDRDKHASFAASGFVCALICVEDRDRVGERADVGVKSVATFPPLAVMLVNLVNRFGKLMFLFRETDF